MQQLLTDNKTHFLGSGTLPGTMGETRPCDKEEEATWEFGCCQIVLI